VTLATDLVRHATESGELVLEQLEANGYRIKVEPMLGFESHDPRHKGERVHAVSWAGSKVLFVSPWLHAQLYGPRFRRKARRWFRWVAAADEAVERALASCLKGTVDR
jgi:hypothetical protein